jgi:hypothetical protein
MDHSEAETTLLRDKIIQALELKGRDFQWMYENLLIAPKSDSYLRNVLSQLKKEGAIGRTMKTYWLMTEERKQKYAANTPTNGQAVVSTSTTEYTDYFCRAIVAKYNEEYFEKIKSQFSNEDGQVFKILGMIVLDEPLPYIKPLEEDDWNDEIRRRWAEIRGGFGF